MHLRTEVRGKVETLEHTDIMTPCLPAVLLPKMTAWSKVDNFPRTSEMRGGHQGRLDFGSMRQNLDRPTTQHMSKRSTCGFVIAKPRCARQVQNLPHTSENAIDLHETDESRLPLERDVSPDKTYHNKPVPFWQVTSPRRARRIPGPSCPLFKFVASSARKGKHLMCFPSCAGL